MDCSKKSVLRDILIININEIFNLISMICFALFILTSITSCHGDKDDILVLNTGVTQGASRSTHDSFGGCITLNYNR